MSIEWVRWSCNRVLGTKKCEVLTRQRTSQPTSLVDVTCTRVLFEDTFAERRKKLVYWFADCWVRGDTGCSAVPPCNVQSATLNAATMSRSRPACCWPALPIPGARYLDCVVIAYFPSSFPSQPLSFFSHLLPDSFCFCWIHVIVVSVGRFT